MTRWVEKDWKKKKRKASATGEDTGWTATTVSAAAANDSHQWLVGVHCFAWALSSSSSSVHYHVWPWGATSARFVVVQEQMHFGRARRVIHWWNTMFFLNTFFSFFRSDVDISYSSSSSKLTWKNQVDRLAVAVNTRNVTVWCTVRHCVCLVISAAVVAIAQSPSVPSSHFLDISK